MERRLQLLRQLHPMLHQRLRELGLLHPSFRTLDLGAGDGSWPDYLSGHGIQAVALDRCSSAGQRFTGYRIQAQAEHLPFRDHSFDCITVLNAWHWFQARLTGRECRRILRPGRPMALVYQYPAAAPGTPLERIDRFLQQCCTDWQPLLFDQVCSQCQVDLWESGWRRLDRIEHEETIHTQADIWTGWLLEHHAAGASLSPDQRTRLHLLVRESFAGGTVMGPFRQTILTAYAS